MRIDLDTIFASAPSPYVLLDPDLRMVWANEAYLAVTGRERDQLIGRIITEEFPASPDSVSDQMLRGSFRRVLATGRTDHLPLIPYPIETDGKLIERFWSATHTPILDPAGRVEFILQNTMDVTDLYHDENNPADETFTQRATILKRTEAVAHENLALGAMTEFFKSAFDQAPSFMAILNGPQHIFQVANTSYTDLIGGRSIIGKPVREALPDLDGQGFFELLDDVYASGDAVSFKGMPAQVIPDPDKPPVQLFVDFIFHPIKDGSGGVTGIFVQGHDITGQKIAEATLTVEGEKFRSMAQTMPNHVWTADKDGSVNWLNDQTYVFTGFNEGDLYGTDWAKVVHPDDFPLAVEKWSTAIAEGTDYDTEFRIRKSDGDFRWHLVRAAPLRTQEGLTIGWVGTNTDIEDLKIAEREIEELNNSLELRVAKRNRELEELHVALRQSQKMEAIGNLAGGIAHDFNNLLQVITSNIQIIARDIPDRAPAQVRVEQAMESVRRGAKLASQLLSFARKQPLAPKVINLCNLLTNTTDILHSAIGEGVALETSFASDLWNTSVDPSNMENAVLNLAINARDAMDGKGELRIDVSNIELDEAFTQLYPDVTPGQYVMLTVSDTGSGMSPDIIDKIFEPFFTTKADGHGTGLGLSMVYGFAKQSGGHITIDSEVGVGTTFKVYLPRSLQDEQVVQPPQSGGLVGGTETILLVEDNNDVRAAAVTMLGELGYTVIEAANADRAMLILEAGQDFDLLFTDVVMPGTATASELADKVKELKPDVPVLFTSGYAQEFIMHDGSLDTGIQLLGKPYTQIELSQKIREVLGSKGMPRPSRPQQTTASSQSSKQRPTGSTILVCEDDILILTDTADVLRDAGYKVFEAENATKALEIVKTAQVDLLITDIGLPDQSGEDLAHEVRGLNPDMPLVFATGGVDDGLVTRMDNCQVLGKPFQEAKLLDVVETALR
ncbi:PAS domain-containing protein [Sulfitobacter sp.]|uniref:PAS domain-containing protein n=1 Tax=Sulfitobacter sp. TaxID=1903071 RepID=UPI00405892F0